MTNHEPNDEPNRESNQEPNHENGLHVRTPCPKRWEDLVGGDVRRYCSECALHVIDGSRLTRGEAHALVANASERVCMRLAIDERGRAIHADSGSGSLTRRPWVARAQRWAVLTTAALMAACRRDDAATTLGTEGGAIGGDPNGAVCTTILGKVAASSVMGDVAGPAPTITPATTPAAPGSTAPTPPGTNDAPAARVPPRNGNAAADPDPSAGEPGLIRLGEVSIQAPPAPSSPPR